jgi:predicted transcriptional regulator of viral defense system
LDNCIKKVKNMTFTPSKTETLYNALLPSKVVTFDEIIQQALKIIDSASNRRYVHHKYIRRLVEAGKLQQIRKGLYAVLSPLENTEKYTPDKLLIASKIRKDYYLGFHTALEYYGAAYSTFNQAYVCVQAKDRFDLFTYKRFKFKPVFVKDTASQVAEKLYGGTVLRVSTKERTLLECITRPHYAGGWEECIKSLENLSGVNAEKTIALALEQKRKTVRRRLGYILELLRSRSPYYEHISDQTLEKLKTEKQGPPQYLVRGKKSKIDKKWNLYVPENFEEELRGA